MIQISMVSDFVCPYCLVAKESLKQALAETGLQAEITMLPYELTEEPGERVDTYSDPNRRAHYQVLVKPCQDMGLDMKLPPYVVPRPYSRLAFEGWHFACEKGCGDDYSEAVFKAYFIDEKDIGDLEVLCELADGLGLDSEEFRRVLLSGDYAQKEKEAVAYAKNVLKVHQVPTIYMNQKQIELKEYSKDEMVRKLKECEMSDAGND